MTFISHILTVYHTIFQKSPSDSSLSSDSSDSDSDHEGEAEPKSRQKASTPDFDEDEATGPSNATTLPQTKNEVVDAIITIPEMEKVESDEELEKVGDVMSLVGNVAIVRGSLSKYVNRGSDRALDSDTLLVFEDRTVMGYVRINPIYLVLLVDASPGRYTKLSVLLYNLSIKSNSTKHTLSILKKLKLGAKSFTSPNGVTLSLSTKSSTLRVATRATCMMRSPQKMRSNFRTMKPRRNIVDGIKEGMCSFIPLHI